MVISLQPLCRRKQRVTEVHCQVGMRAGVKYGLLAAYGGGHCKKKRTAGTLP